MPTLTIFAGPNGAGKSTLYSYQKSINNKADLGIRINPDEILRTSCGNWQNPRDVLKASKVALDLIRDCIKNKKSFNWETTIFTKYNIKFLEQAKKQGFKINLYYVCVDSALTAVERVKIRVSSGGHGIDEDIVRSRYGTQFLCMHKALKFIDNAIFIDNTTTPKIVATYIDNMLTHSSETTSWVKNLPFICEDVKSEKKSN